MTDDDKSDIFDFLVENAINKKKVSIPIDQAKTMKDEWFQLYNSTVTSYLTSELAKTRVLMTGSSKTVPYGFGNEHLSNKNMTL